MPAWDQVALVTLGIFIVGLIYDAGGKANRLSQLEKWQDKVDVKMDALLRDINEVKGMVRPRMPRDE